MKLRHLAPMLAMGLAIPPIATAQSADENDAEDRSHCIPNQQGQRNRDGSRLRLRSLCVPGADADAGDAGISNSQRFEIDYARPGSDDFTLSATVEASDMDDNPSGYAGFVDIDNDGYFEVEVRGMCGAGPNCLGDLYRLDRATGTVQHFFSGGYADLYVLDGHLVEAGRASCCAWEFHAWRMDGPTRLRSYDNMDLMITVEANGNESGDAENIRCTFSRQRDGQWQVVRPPNAKWHRICAHYGEPYHIVTPAEAARRAAGNNRD